ncbi:MAG: hypothetical protein E4H03_09090 [Myxococcales bacterium]|jgi:hypothetical protein|nr:MAG: hypothetical protein E4H03_09090 [Myxococcales bacterium]
MIETVIPPEWKEQWNELVKQLRDPFKLRLTVLGIAAAIGFFGVYRPMDKKITEVRREVGAGRARLDLIRQVESLRTKQAQLRESLPEYPSINFWTEHFLEGIRDTGVALSELESQPKKIKIGDYDVVYFNIDVTGQYDQVHALLSWIESNRWYSRVVRMNFKKKLNRIEAKLTVAVAVEKERSHGA